MNSKVTVVLNDYTRIKKFCNEVSAFESDIDLIKGRYVVDAKSLMGVFTIDLSLPVDVVIYSEDEEEIERFNRVMEEFR